MQEKSKKFLEFLKKVCTFATDFKVNSKKIEYFLKIFSINFNFFEKSHYLLIENIKTDIVAGIG